jgi:L-fuculose-phosphate aldolase
MYKLSRELEDICTVMKTAYDRNLITPRDGNISIKKGNFMYITPSGVLKHTLKPQDMVGFKFEDGSTSIEISKKPSGELEMHTKLQFVDLAEQRCVIHMHPTFTIAAMHKGFNLQDIAKDFPELSRYTRVAYNVRTLPVTSSILASETLSALTDSSERLQFDIVGQANHGVCAVGTSVREAFEHIERLEHCCKIVILSGVSSK